MERILLEAARNVENCSGLAAVRTVLADTFRQFEIPDFIYENVPDTPPGETIILSTIRDNWPENGQQYAKARNEEWFDPFLAYCCATFETTKAGREYLPDHDYVGAGSKAYVGVLAEFGLVSGLAIPCRLKGTGRHGGFVICSSFDRYRFERQIMPLAGQLQTFCLIAHRRIEDIILDRKSILERKPLSARERQTLSLLARGMRAKEIAHTLGVSEASIRLYTKNARSKLGSRTREEAVIQAMKDGLLET